MATTSSPDARRTSGTATPGTTGGVVVTAMLGLGAAMLLLAAVPGTVRDGEGTATSHVLAGGLLLAGLTALVWSLLSLRRGQVLLPRAAAVVAFVLVAAGAWAYTGAQELLLAVLPGARLPGTAQLTTAALLVLTSFGAVLTRHRAGTPAGTPRTSAGVRLLTLAAGAGLVGALVTPGLAASAAGEYAVPHGEHHTSADDTGKDASTTGAAPAAPAPQAQYLDRERAGRPAPAGHTH